MPVSEQPTRPPESASRPRKALTIGAVCKILQGEFDDVSISKIRYLEDQKLLNPRRTSGGYRLYSQSDVERLRTILRLQRDEFLPLRVIRQELAGGGDLVLGDSERKPANGAARRAILVDTSRAYLTLDEVVEETGAREELIAELENFGIVQPEKREGKVVYDETDREIVRAANELSRVGVGARNLRVFRSSADREAQLLEALLGPSLRSRNPERRKEALQSLESLAATVSHLKHLLLVRDLRRLAGDWREAGAAARCHGVTRRAARSRSARVARRSGSLVSDPYSLPRWWPRTGRVENVEQRGSGRRSQWTKVLETSEGRGVRADFRCVSSAENERYVWEQELEGTPFARHLRSSRIEIALRESGDGTQVDLSSVQTLKGMSRLGSPMMRRGQGEILDEALDGIEGALT